MVIACSAICLFCETRNETNWRKVWDWLNSDSLKSEDKVGGFGSNTKNVFLSLLSVILFSLLLFSIFFLLFLSHGAYLPFLSTSLHLSFCSFQLPIFPSSTLLFLTSLPSFFFSSSFSFLPSFFPFFLTLPLVIYKDIQCYSNTI